VVAATSKSDFDIREMRKKPMTVYLGIPADQLERLAPIMNLFVQQFVSLLSRHRPDPNTEPYRVLAILDEFTNLGKMTKLRKGFSYLAGYHIHLMPVIQNLAEFYAIYGKHESDTFLQNIDYKIMYRQNDETNKIFVSKNLGQRTVKVKTQSRHRNSRNAGGTTTGETIIARPLLSPDEVELFPKDKAIIKLSGEHPIKFKRIIYYKNAIFKNRVLPPVDIPTIEPLYPTIQVKMKTAEFTASEPPVSQPIPEQEMQEALTVYEQTQQKGVGGAKLINAYF
jgi:type IV secretion system protein VirD4